MERLTSNILKGKLKHIYLDLESYKDDFEELKLLFLTRYNTKNPKHFIEHEIQRYTQLMNVARGEITIPTDISAADYTIVKHNISKAFFELKPELIEQTEIFFNSLGHRKYDKTFVSVACENIVEYLKNQINSRNSPKNFEPLNFELNQQEVIWLFDVLIAAQFLKEPKYQDGSYYRKLEMFFTANKKPIKDSEQKKDKYLRKGIASKPELKKKLISAIEKL